MSLTLMQRHLDLGRLAAIELATQVLTTASTLVWALFDPSVWALLGGTVIGYVARVAMSYVVARGAPLGFGWERESIRQLLRFGVWIFFSTALFFLTTQADRLLFGWLLSVKTLGVYGVAMALAMIPTQLAWNLGNFVLLPTFSRQAQAGQSLEASYRRLQLLVLVPGALPVAGLLACGPELVEILYDPRYQAAGWMLQLAAVGTWFQIPQALSANALLALGEPHWMAIANAMKLVGMVVLVSAGYLLFGAGGAIGGVAISETLRWASLAYGVRRRGLPGFRADLTCSLLVLAAGAAALLATELVRRAGFGPLARLAAGVAALLAVWLPAAALLLRDHLQPLWLRFGRRVNG
jgi:O-antigen/teichoic acid export membrane protein